MSDGLWMAFGVALLANTRPYEGTLLCAPVFCALIWRLAMKPHLRVLVLLRRAIAPIALLALTASAMVWYNYRVFGDPLKLPYEVNRATYASARVFLWESPRKEPVYRHRVMHEFYSKWELSDFLYARTLPGFISRTAQKLGTVVFFFYGTAFFAPLAMLPWVFRDRRMRFLIVAGAVSAIGLCMNAWLFPHYLAPFAAAMYVLLLQAMRHLRAWRPHRHRYGLALVRMTVVLCVVLTGVRMLAAPLGIAVNRWPTMWYGTAPLGLGRARVLSALEGYAGPQLAIVRYSSTHSVFDEWVYNAAEIDKAKVVWAREMDAPNDAELLRYFSNRRVWLVEPDSSPPRISPYELSSRAGP